MNWSESNSNKGFTVSAMRVGTGSRGGADVLRHLLSHRLQAGLTSAWRILRSSIQGLFPCSFTTHSIAGARAVGHDDYTKEVDVSPYDQQGRYAAALAKIGATHAPRDIKRYTPIFQRDAAATQRQAVKDAATALRVLWKQSASKP